MKKKHLNTLKIASLTLMLGCFTVGGVYNHYEKQQNNVVKVERKVQPKYVSYDDEHYSITFTPDEFNNYVWNNFNEVAEYKINNLELPFFSGESGSSSYDENDGEKYAIISKGNYRFNCYVDSNLDSFNTYDNKWHYLDDEDITDSYTLSDINPLIYADIKSAIELDIQANQPVNQGESIIGAITSGLGLIPDLANEFLTGFSMLFWNSTNDTLTTFGLFALVFLGIAITMAVIKLVLAIIRGNTGA